MAGLCRLQERVHGPVVGFGRAACRIHFLHVDAGVFFHQVDAGAGTLDLAADAGGNAHPLAVQLAEIGDGAVHGAVLLDDRVHDVVHGLQQVGIGVRPPGRHPEDIVA